MKKYLEKYTLGMVTVLIAIAVAQGPSISIVNMTWRHVIAGILILPALFYFIDRANDDYSDADTPYFTWQRFWLFISLLLGAIAALSAVILTGLFL